MPLWRIPAILYPRENIWSLLMPRFYRFIISYSLCFKQENIILLLVNNNLKSIDKTPNHMIERFLYSNFLVSSQIFL